MINLLKIIMPDNSVWQVELDDIVTFLAVAYRSDHRVTEEEAEERIRAELTPQMIAEQLDWDSIRGIAEQIIPPHPDYGRMFANAELKIINDQEIPSCATV